MKYLIRLYAAGDDGRTPALERQRVVWQDVREARVLGPRLTALPTVQESLPELRVVGAGPTGVYHGHPVVERVRLVFDTAWPEDMVDVGLAGGAKVHGGFRATWEPLTTILAEDDEVPDAA